MITRKTSRMAISSLSENVKIKIHQHGSVYAPKTLLNNTFNEEYNPDYFVTYIENKYLGVLNPRLFAQRHILILLHHFFIFFLRKYTIHNATHSFHPSLIFIFFNCVFIIIFTNKINQ